MQLKADLPRMACEPKGGAPCLPAFGADLKALDRSGFAATR